VCVCVCVCVCVRATASRVPYCVPVWEWQSFGFGFTRLSNILWQFNVCHPEVFNTHINIQWCISQTQQNFIMFIIVLGQRVSIFIESSSDPSKIQILT